MPGCPLRTPQERPASASGEVNLTPENLVRRSFKPLLREANLPDIRFHDLRHTCATLLLGRGVHPKFVQSLLGHASIEITLNTYSHVMPEMGDAVALAMDDALEADGPPTGGR